jgi:PucR family transcriptional regulator, purine catabolism regulatory protein
VLTVQSLVDDLKLPLLAGEENADAPLRWVHITELLDPTPWLAGGELLLTTGLQLQTPAKQRQFIRRLTSHHLAGLGFGTGFEHSHMPNTLLTEARRLEFPIFEVPYEMPFIAITENAFGRLVNDQYEMLQRGISFHKRLEQLVLEEQGLDEVARALAAATGGAIAVLDRSGDVMAACEFRRKLPKTVLRAIGDEILERREAGKPVMFAPEHQAVSGRALALPVGAGGREGPQAWLVAVRDSGALADFERLILQQAVTVVALELMRRRVVRDTERRLAGDVLEEVLSGSTHEDELAGRLRPFGVGAQSAVLLFELPDPRSAESTLQRMMSDAGVGALVAAHGELLCAVIDTTTWEPIALAEHARELLSERHGEVRAAASRRAGVEALRRSFHEARCALEVAALRNGDTPMVASYRDLGAFQFLLSVQDDEALRMYCESVLGAIEDGEGKYGGELLRSLEAFLEHNGQWEGAARELYCHRHTLRYRIRRVEELTGRDLSSARDRIEFWLALQARELVQ